MDPTKPIFHDSIRKDILRCEVGSTAHGVSLSGTDDLDLMGVCIETPDNVIGLGNFETFIYRTAAEREHKHDARSQPGDIDLTIHSLRKFCRLAAKGNPSILLMFYAPVLMCSSEGHYLRSCAHYFASKRVGKQFLGYMANQRERMLGLRGQKDVKRPELVEKYGFDTKYAMHMLRLGLQGVEYMQTGKISVPMLPYHIDHLKKVRTGRFTEKECAELGRELEATLEDSLITSPLPPEPDTENINKLLEYLYLSAWGYVWQELD